MQILNRTPNFYFSILGWAILISLAIFSIIFYLERTIFCDIAFHTFYILNRHQFIMGHNRFGAVFTQIFPYTASLLGFSLKNILLTYSLGYIIYYATIFVLIAYVFKNKMMALVQIGFYVWMASDRFYWMQSELQQGISFLLLYFSMLIFYGNKRKPMNALFHSIWMIPTCLFFHPLLIFPFAFLLLYFSVIEKNISVKIAMAIVLITAITMFIKTQFFIPDYDKLHLEGLHNFKTLFPNYFQTQSFANFISYCSQDYGFWFLFSAIIFVWMWWYGKRKIVVFTIVSSFFYLLLINVSNPDGGNKFYFDNMYSVLCLLFAIPIFFSNTIPWNTKPAWLAAIFVFTIIRIGMVYKAHEIYTNRLKWHQEMLTYCTQKHISKLCIPASKPLTDKLLNTWSVAYEAMLFSSLENKNSITYFITNQQNIFNDIAISNKNFDGKTPNKTFYAEQWMDDVKTFNPIYFHLANVPYHLKSAE